MNRFDRLVAPEGVQGQHPAGHADREHGAQQEHDHHRAGPGVLNGGRVGVGHRWKSGGCKVSGLSKGLKCRWGCARCPDSLTPMGYAWSMTEIRIEPDQLPPWGAALGPALAALTTRSVAMGVLSGPPVTRLDSALVKRLVKALQRHRIGAHAGVILAPLTVGSGRPMDRSAQEQVASGLKQLNEALEASATPETEWPAMRAVFGDDKLVRLLGVAPSSLRRYAGGERATPDDVATRLHWLAMVVADLAGAYNEFGMRRWFERPRTQLGGKSPQQVLGGSWSPDGAAAQRVRELASVLTGAQPLAA